MSAIASFLTPKHAEILARYRELVPGTVWQFGPTADASARPIEALVTPERRDSIAADGQRRASAIESVLAAKTTSGGTVATLEPAAVAEAAGEHLAQRLATEMLIIEALDAADALDPIELVVLNEDLTLERRTAVAWAKARGIPNVVLSHSCILGRLYTIHRAVNADEIVVFGERGRAPYRDAGIPDARVIAAANPAWATVAQRALDRGPDRAAIRSAHGFGPDDPVVVFGTTWAANLTAFCDDEAYERTLRSVFAAYREAREAVPSLRLIIKDRPANASLGPVALAIAAQCGLRNDEYAIVTGDPEPYILGADVVVSVDSNLSIEATLAGVPAVNIWTPQTWLLGPFFSADDGIVNVLPEHLAEAMVVLATDAATAARTVRDARATVENYGGVPGPHSARRIAERLAAKRRQRANPAAASAAPAATVRQPAPDGPRYVWHELTRPAHEGPKAIDGFYNAKPRTELFELFAHKPRVVMDVGCATGTTAAEIKRVYGSRAIGIETDEVTAGIARTRLDLVLAKPVEKIEPADGIAPNSVDTVILADVLEHLYDPWNTLVSMRALLTPDVQLIASIPNTRNLWLMHELAAGNWDYAVEGLLDVTHIRFFTLKTIGRLFAETGYRIEVVGRIPDGRVAGVRSDFTGTNDVKAGRMTLHGLTPQEVLELTSMQFLVRARPA